MNESKYSIISLGKYIPENKLTLKELIKNYPDERERLEKYGYNSISVEQSLSSSAMALNVVNKVLETKSTQLNLSLIVYACIHHQENTGLWCPASYIQKELKETTALPMSIRQGCNGAMMSIQLSMGYLDSCDKQSGSLIVASDKFSGTSFDRVTSDYGIVYGDGASALIIGKDKGIAKIIVIETVSDPVLNELHLNKSDTTNNDSHWDTRKSKKNFLSQYSEDELKKRTREALNTLKNRIFLEGRSENDVVKIIFPHLSKELLENNYYPIFHNGKNKSFNEYGETTGHLGSSDQFASFHELLMSGLVVAGDIVLLIGAGAGFSWTGMLVRIEQ
ncbi:ketoacyl-ACP synthase III family protein [Xenorhabdus innexi]|uniref:3-oxoacyl-ACP synthase n=1 Tax=Xenorhabdus innexi TaxID=290109 RepID=A0A1N6MT75_9GAMM|nr:ketoacyl-ACP synthase III family protein [Xenorhabdus innexi]PHM29441.1 3-oxoacyl-ACP synthase [Xenorhabdus innexi]SIP72047.1 putative 3-Oxoacyl-(Acyl-carrier-protein (ACP)) synthase III domain protein [Xenorhabdus innexi]